MAKKQITKMITIEAITYALSGCMIGCFIGIGINKLLFNKLIANHFTYATWEFPIIPIVIIIAFVIVSVLAAMYSPSRRMSNMEITEIINEL